MKIRKTWHRKLAPNITVDKFNYYKTSEGTVSVTLTDGQGRRFSAKRRALLRSGHTFVELTIPLVKQLNINENWPDMDLRVGGEAEESMESIRNLAFTFIIAFVGIYFLLILLFNSFTQPFMVLAAIPFGIVGVIIALIIHEQPLSFIAIIGTIGLAGVVVNDSLVLVNHLNELKAQNPEKELRDIVALGTANRLRAIILTTLTTVAGVLPLAYGLGGTDYFISPMALALGYGLLFATPLTLMLIPCLYMIWNDIGRLFRRKS